MPSPSRPSRCHWYLKNRELIKTLLEVCFHFDPLAEIVLTKQLPFFFPGLLFFFFFFSSVFSRSHKSGPVAPMSTEEMQNPHSIINYTYYSLFPLWLPLSSLSCAWWHSSPCTWNIKMFDIRLHTLASADRRKRGGVISRTILGCLYLMLNLDFAAIRSEMFDFSLR